MAVDWETTVGAPTVAVFGEAATYYPASGAPSFPVTGVFDNQFRSSSVKDDEAPESDSLPVFGVNSRQFATPPVQDDKLIIASTGKIYLVKEPRPDGHGIYHLVLNEAAS